MILSIFRFFFFSFLPKLPSLGHICISTRCILVYGHSFWPMFGLHLVREPKTSKIALSKNLTMEKACLSGGNFVVHDINK